MERKILKECENVKELVKECVKQYKENIAFVIKHKKGKEVTYENVTYEELLKNVNALGTKFFDLGFQNKRVAIVGRNRYEWCLTHLTNLSGGIVSIPLDKELQVDELESCIIRSKADIVVFDEKYQENIEEIKKRNNGNLSEYICMSKLDGYMDILSLLEDGKKLIESGREEFINKEIDSNKLAILLFTSGTTSKSKAVMLSQKNVASNVYGLDQIEVIYDTDVNLAFLPFHHIFGSTCMLVMLSYGVKTAFPDGLRYVAQNLKEYEVSVFVGVPLLIDAIYSKIEKTVKKQGKEKVVAIARKVGNVFAKLNINVRRKLFKQILEELGGHLRFVISGGAPLDKRVAQGFNEIGINVCQGYGLTETAPVIAAEYDGFQKYGSIGKAIPGVEIDLYNKDENGVGEIRVKGPNIMLGYYENEEATNEVLKDGWFHTGDLAYYDKDGFLFINGRKKDMIVLKNGKKVFPDELETLVNRLDEVLESIVFGIPDEEDKNNIKLAVKVVYDKEATDSMYPGVSEEELEKIIWQKIKDINKTLPPYKYMKSLILTDKELIKTTTKKVKRNEEIKQYVK